MGFCERAAKVVFAGESFTEGADVGGAEGEEGEEEAGAESNEVEAPSKSGSDEDECVGETVGSFVEERSVSGRFFVFDGNEAIEEVAHSTSENCDNCSNCEGKDGLGKEGNCDQGEGCDESANHA